MNYANLIQNITENIKTNGSQAITAQVLQDVLVDMVGELGQSGALLGGVIDTSFVPDPTNDAQVVYIAESPGTYTNFNGLVVGAGEVAFFYFDGNAWVKSSVDVLEVVNNLNSTATDKALSAAMGKQLQDSLTQAVQDLTTAIGNKADRQTTEQALNTLQNQINDKADTTYVNSQLATKADTASVNAALALKADTSAVNAALATKADTSALAAKADKVVGAVAGNMAGLDADGNLVDSGINSSAVGDVSDKIDKVHDAEVGNVPMFKADGGIEDGGVAADNIAEQDGYYETLVAGAAENLIGRGTVPAHYTRRRSGGGSIGSGAAVLEEIQGNTLVWNQLAELGVTFQADLHSSISNGVLTLQCYSAANLNQWNITPQRGIVGHIYLTYLKYISSVNFRFGAAFVSATSNRTAASSYTMIKELRTCDNTNRGLYFQVPASENPTTSDYISIKDVVVIDLTQMFGPGNEPSTVAEFEALFPLNYYPHNTGSLLNLTATGLQSNGFNQWDEEWEVGSIDSSGQNTPSTTRIRSKNYIPVFPSTTYYYRIVQNPNTASDAFFYDAEKNFISQVSSFYINTTFTTPANCYYMRFVPSSAYGTTYKNNICINFSDSAYNGNYEPYWSETHTLPITTATSGGVAVFPDGEKSAGGKADRYYKSQGSDLFDKAEKWIASRAYQAGDESDSTVKTDGTTTYYALSTPTDYTLDTPFSAQYRVDGMGTETLLPQNTATPTTSPINAEVKYPMNAVDTLRNLPQSYISKASMDAILTAFKTAGVITNYTLTWDATNQKYNCSITV